MVLNSATEVGSNMTSQAAQVISAFIDRHQLGYNRQPFRPIMHMDVGDWVGFIHGFGWVGLD